MNSCEKRGLIDVRIMKRSETGREVDFLTEKQNLKPLMFFTSGKVARPAKIRESLSGLTIIPDVEECALKA